MTLKRRLDGVETSLTPTQLVLRWLAEAHAFCDVVPSVDSLLAVDPPVVPAGSSLDRVDDDPLAVPLTLADMAVDRICIGRVGLAIRRELDPCSA